MSGTTRQRGKLRRALTSQDKQSIGALYPGRSEEGKMNRFAAVADPLVVSALVFPGSPPGSWQAWSLICSSSVKVTGIADTFVDEILIVAR